jgi:hypothetical protein
VLNRFLIFTLFLLPCFKLSGQCTSVKIETDAFDSTRVIYDKPLNIGGLVTSNFEVEEGNKMVEEAKLLVSYAENDSIESFFLTLALMEWEYQVLEAGENVMLLLENGSILKLNTVEDRGTLDKKTNMRRYEAVSVLPIDLYYALALFKIDKIRLQYKSGIKRTVSLFIEQQKKFQQIIRCVGEAAGVMPVKP